MEPERWKIYRQGDGQKINQEFEGTKEWNKENILSKYHEEKNYKEKNYKEKNHKEKSLNERQERKVSISKKKGNYSVQVEAFTAKTVRK